MILSSLVASANKSNARDNNPKVTIVELQDRNLAGHGNMFGFDLENVSFTLTDETIDAAIRHGFDHIKNVIEHSASGMP
jgi:hypothetical protein